jgi:hypothetical protein
MLVDFLKGNHIATATATMLWLWEAEGHAFCQFEEVPKCVIGLIVEPLSSTSSDVHCKLDKPGVGCTRLKAGSQLGARAFQDQWTQWQGRRGDASAVRVRKSSTGPGLVRTEAAPAAAASDCVRKGRPLPKQAHGPEVSLFRHFSL